MSSNQITDEAISRNMVAQCDVGLQMIYFKATLSESRGEWYELVRFRVPQR